MTFDIFFVIGSMIFFVVFLLMFIWTDIGTLLVIFYIYSNLAVIAKRFHDVPHLAAASVPLLLCIPLVNYVILRKERLIIDRTFLMMLAFFVVLSASSLFAKDMSLVKDAIGNFVVEGLVLYLLIINTIRNLETLRRVIWVLVLTGSLFGALSLYQAVTQSYENQYGGFATTSLILSRSIQPGSQTPIKVHHSQRAQGAIGEPNRYAQTMLVLVPLAFFLLWTERSRLLRIGAAATGFFILWGILLSFSRGGFVTLALLLLILTFLRYIRLYQILIAVPVLLLLVAVAAPKYFERIGSIAGVEGLYTDEARVEPDGAIRGRLTEMLAALLVFVDHPVLGVGPGQYAAFYSVDYQLNSDIAFRHLPIVRRAHNLYVEIAAETGTIGLGTFMAIVLVLMVRLWQARRRWAHSRPDLTNLTTAFWLSIIAYLVTGMFAHLSYQRYYWFLLALAGATLHISQSATAPGDGLLEATLESPPRHVQRSLAQ